MVKKILIITFSIGDKLPRCLYSLEHKGVCVHQAREESRIIERVKERFDYLLIDRELFGIKKLSESIMTAISTFDIHTQVLEFSQDEAKDGKLMPIYEASKEVPEPLVEFVERITEVELSKT